ncbi:MAG: PAAR domain-containing protein, partial [Candidatus Competibacterales bacterium]|nr:PAAR domain-containing protein [Candidatus Competibacterales bacterium]
GPAIKGSPTVLVNNRPALRVTDNGIHAACCNGNIWVATMGSATVLINYLPAHRLGDMDTHCGGVGQMIEGSGDVITGG